MPRQPYYVGSAPPYRPDAPSAATQEPRQPNAAPHPQGRSLDVAPD